MVNQTAHNMTDCVPLHFLPRMQLDFSLRLSPKDGLTGGEGSIVIDYVLTRWDRQPLHILVEWIRLRLPW